MNENNKRDNIYNSSKKSFSFNRLMNKTFIIVILLIILAIICITYKTIVFLSSGNLGKTATENMNDFIIGHEGTVTTDLQSNIQDVIEKTDLYVKEYPYNDYIPVRDEKGNIKYYVLYRGIIEYGINVEEINVSAVDDKIIIEIPPAEIKNYDVRKDEKNALEYIYVQKKYQTNSNTHTEAYEAAKRELKNAAYTNKEMLDSATSEARNTIYFLTSAVIGDKQKIEVVVNEK